MVEIKSLIKNKKNPFMILLFSFVFLLFNLTKADAVDDYPYYSSSYCHKEYEGGPVVGCEVDIWNFYKRQCTSYSAWKADNIIGNFMNTMTGPNGLSATFGNAEHWNDAASYIGFSVDSSPEVGDIAGWEAGQGGAGSAGHVARVDSVNGDNTVNISEYNWNASAANFYMGDASYNTRTNITASWYIHFGGVSCGGTNITIQNQTITSNLSCYATNSITILPTTLLQPSGDNVIRFYIQ